MNVKHLTVPGVLVVFSVAVIWASLQLELSPPMIVGESMQPRAFPIFLMVVNLLLIGVLVFQVYRMPPPKIELEAFPTWGTMALLAVFYALATTLDLFIGITVVMFLMCRLWGERRLYVAAAVALITPAVIFALFDLVLKIRFPRGLLTNWYYG